MKKLYRLLIVAAIACSSFIAKAQNDVMFTLLPHVPYVNYYNPGINVPYKGHIGIITSNFNISYSNSSVQYKNIFSTNSLGEDVIDGPAFVNSLAENDNFINLGMSLDLVNVGFRINKLYFNIDWRFQFNTDFQYSKDFVGLFVFGNGHYLGYDNPCDFNIDTDITAYAEYALGVQYAFNDKLTVGVRPKLLSGLANINIKNDDTKIFTDPDTYAISADIDLSIKAASILESDVARIKDIEHMFDDDKSGGKMYDVSENLGFGIDFGASYKFNEHWGVAAGVYDLGYVRWRDAKVKEIKKNGVNVNEALFDDYNKLKDMELDYKTMLEDVVDAVWGNDSLVGDETYKTSLKTRIMLQGYYEFSEKARITLMGQMYKTIIGMKPAITVAYSGSFWDHLDLSASYSYSKYTGSAVGAGIAFHGGAFNIYAVSDNLLMLTKATATSMEFATTYKSAGLRMGIIWTIGKYNE